MIHKKKALNCEYQRRSSSLHTFSSFSSIPKKATPSMGCIIYSIIEDNLLLLQDFSHCCTNSHLVAVIILFKSVNLILSSILSFTMSLILMVVLWSILVSQVHECFQTAIILDSQLLILRSQFSLSDKVNLLKNKNRL